MYASTLVWDNGKNLGIMLTGNESLLSRIVCSIRVVNVGDIKSIPND